ncbi:unnamed protein product [Rangifer tarandus platyrhynchus]|uniref:Uncharacterized protein n=2 Tax=Rangifer tarandus platyrhynchus TaxID=3082113 RepID=A0ABN9A4E2_RANTA|nr:unnamed protein product [Rangifer tarandus platyrhynchus]
MVHMGWSNHREEECDKSKCVAQCVTQIPKLHAAYANTREVIMELSHGSSKDLHFLNITTGIIISSYGYGGQSISKRPFKNGHKGSDSKMVEGKCLALILPKK